MNGFAPLLAALAIVQPVPPEAPQAAAADGPAATEREPAAAPAKEPAAAPAKEPAAAPAGAPAPSPSLASTTARPARAPRPAAPAAPSPTAITTTKASTSAPSPRPSPPLRGGEGGPPRTSTPTTTSTATSTPTSTATVPQPAPRRPLPEREEAERAARAFLDALVARDADALAAASAERFSFDGDAQAGREAVRRTWRAILAGREGAPPRIGSLEILPAADAVARFGQPPARIAPLARPGVLVAVADVGGRTVMLFLAKDGGRMAVLGMHD